MSSICQFIEELLYFSLRHLHLENDDVVFYRNYLMHELDVKEYHFDSIDELKIATMDNPDYFVTYLHDYLLNKNMNEIDIDKKITEIFGTLMPRPSEIRKEFEHELKKNPLLATTSFYDLSIKSNYVQKSKIMKNIVYQEKYDGHDLIVTINLSKPEKSNKDIAKLLTDSHEGDDYPLCPICLENEGCYGSNKTSCRNNLRLIPMILGGKRWYFQYSPYGYFNEHCIVLSENHEKMCVNKTNLHALLDFVDILPHYFIGSNSDLPIVGGSILNHEHFQGGRFDMPIMKAKEKQRFNIKKHPNVTLSLLEWPGSCFKYSSDKQIDLLEALDDLLIKWKQYQNPLININDSSHNTMTTLLRKVNEQYEAFVILRNNETSKQYPDGVFHVRPSLQHIKKEGIGLIEAGGLFILPPRLKRQLAIINNIKSFKDKEQILKNNKDLQDFTGMIDDILLGKFKDSKQYLFYACNEILKDISVFKFDDEKKTNLLAFLHQIID